MRQHQVWGARQEEGREAFDILWGIAGDLHIGETQARKVSPEALGPHGSFLPTHGIRRICDTTDLDAVAPLLVLIEGPASEDFSIIGMRQNRHDARHAPTSTMLSLSFLRGCPPATVSPLTSCSVLHAPCFQESGSLV